MNATRQITANTNQRLSSDLSDASTAQLYSVSAQLIVEEKAKRDEFESNLWKGAGTAAASASVGLAVKGEGQGSAMSTAIDKMTENYATSMWEANDAANSARQRRRMVWDELMKRAIGVPARGTSALDDVLSTGTIATSASSPLDDVLSSESTASKATSPVKTQGALEIILP